jgi:thioredoxin-related protein
VLLIPTVLFFDADGNEVFRHVGYLAPEQLEAEFRKAGLLGVAAGG